MASADFCMGFPTPLDVSSTEVPLGTHADLPGYDAPTFTLMPVGFTSRRSVQVSGFTDIGLLTPPRRLVSASCSSGQRFAFGFLQISSHPEHPCRSANSSPCRASRGLPPPSECALPGAPTKKGTPQRPFFCCLTAALYSAAGAAGSAVIAFIDRRTRPLFLVRPAGRTHLEVEVLYSPDKGKS